MKSGVAMALPAPPVAPPLRIVCDINNVWLQCILTDITLCPCDVKFSCHGKRYVTGLGLTHWDCGHQWHNQLENLVAT